MEKQNEILGNSTQKFAYAKFLTYLSPSECNRTAIKRHLEACKIMAQTAMTVRVDNNLKKQFDALCERFGLSANAAINVFINAVVRTHSIPFKISVEEDAGSKALNAFLSTDRAGRPQMTIDEINDEIRAARKERQRRSSKDANL